MSPNSIKVALSIGQLCIGKLLLGGHSSRAMLRVPKRPMPNCQWPIAKATFIEFGIQVPSGVTKATYVELSNVTHLAVYAS